VLDFAAFARRPNAGQGCDQIATVGRLMTLHGEAPKTRLTVPQDC